MKIGIFSGITFVVNTGSTSLVKKRLKICNNCYKFAKIFVPLQSHVHPNLPHLATIKMVPINKEFADD